MKLATYNVNGINGRLKVLLRWLAEARPDVVCLQELKAPDEKFPRREIERAGYGAIWHGQKSGTALRSLPAIRNRAKPDEVFPATPTTATAATSQPRSTVSSWAVFIFPMEIQRPARSSTTSSAGSNACTPMRMNCWKLEVPVALVGDFNVMPTELDVYKPERWLDDALFRPEVRAAYADLVAQGWTDAIRFLHPDERIYTFWKYFRNSFARDAGLRIDHFLLSPSLCERLTASGVDKFARGWEHTSDHAPVLIELDEG